jgi:hypothetical protein
VALALTVKAHLTIPSETSTNALEAYWFFNFCCAKIKLERDSFCKYFLVAVLNWSITLNALSAMALEKGKVGNKEMQGIKLGNLREFVTV